MSKLSSFYLSKRRIRSGSTKSKVIRDTPPIEAKGKAFREKTEKQSKEIIWLATALVVALFGKT